MKRGPAKGSRGKPLTNEVKQRLSTSMKTWWENLPEAEKELHRARSATPLGRHTKRE